MPPKKRTNVTPVNSSTKSFKMTEDTPISISSSPGMDDSMIILDDDDDVIEIDEDSTQKLRRSQRKRKNSSSPTFHVPDPPKITRRSISNKKKDAHDSLSIPTTKTTTKSEKNVTFSDSDSDSELKTEFNIDEELADLEADYQQNTDSLKTTTTTTTTATAANDFILPKILSFDERLRLLEEASSEAMKSMKNIVLKPSEKVIENDVKDSNEIFREAILFEKCVKPIIRVSKKLDYEWSMPMKFELSKSLEYYCGQYQVDPKIVRLEFDGEDLDLSETPEDIDLEDGFILELRLPSNVQWTDIAKS